MEWGEPAEEKKKSMGASEIGAVLFVILTVIVSLCYLTIFINPQILFNPFPPPSIKLPPTQAVSQSLPTATSAARVQATPTMTYPPTWTPTPTRTATPTRTPRPTVTPTKKPSSGSGGGSSSASTQFSLYMDPIYTAQKLYQGQSVSMWWTGLAGEVTDKAGKPVTNVIIKVWDDRGHVWQTNPGDASAYTNAYTKAFGNRGTYAWWEQFVCQGSPEVVSPCSCQDSFPVHVQVIQNGVGVSPVIDLTTTGNCQKNLILVHFQKNW